MPLPVFSALFAALAASMPAPGPDTTAYGRAEIVRELPALLKVDSLPYGYSVDLDTAGAVGPLGALARANGHYVLYLVQNGLDQGARAAVFTGSRAAVRQQLVARLAGDSAFVATVGTAVGRHRGLAPGARSAAPPATRLREVNFGRVLDVASRLFYPDAVLPSGYIQSHVCVGINGVVDMQGGRDLAVEAFAYAAIFHDLLKPTYYVTADFNSAARLINAMDLSSDRETRLQRAQGVMWATMLQSEKLRQVLAAEYRRTKDYLPFRITDAPADGAGAARP